MRKEEDMAFLIIVCIIVVIGALIWGVVAWWQLILTILGALGALILGFWLGAGVWACSRILAHRDLKDGEATDYVCLVCAAIAALLVEIKFGFLSWTWPLAAVVVPLVIWVLFQKKTWSILADVSIILFKDVLLDSLVLIGRKIIQFARWTGLVIRHGGIGKYRQALKAEQERKLKAEKERKEKEAERKRKEVEDAKKAEEEREKQEAEEKKRLEEEAKRKEAIRKDKESRALSELDQIKLKKLAKERRISINAKMESHKRTEQEHAKIVCIDSSAFNVYDVPYAKIEFAFRAFGIHVPVSVAFSLERVVKVVIGGTEYLLTEWSDVEDRLERCLILAQTEFEVFSDVDEEARCKRYAQEDAVLARRKSGSVEKPAMGGAHKLDIVEDLKLRALAFRRMQEINGILRKYKAPVRADFSSVCIDSSYGNQRGLPHAEIAVGLVLFDKPLQILIAFDCNKVIECKIGADVKSVHSWEEACEELCPYLEPMTDEWQKADDARELAQKQKKLRQIAQAEEFRAAEMDREEKESKALDDFGELELRSIAHKRRQEINHILEHFKRSERIDEEAIVVDPKAFNVFDQPYAKFGFRLKLIGKLYDYEICLNKDDVLQFAVNSNVISIGGWSDVINEISRMLVLSEDAGIDDANDDSPHTCFCRIAYLQNFDTHLRELATMAGVDRVDSSALDVTIKKQMDEGNVYCDEEWRACPEEKSKFQIYETGLREKETSRPIRAQYWRNDEGMWCGVNFVTRGMLPAKNASNEDGRLQYWVGVNNSDRHRQEDNGVAIIISKLKQMVETGAIDWVHVLYNFTISRKKARIRHRQIDLALIVRNSILLIELKHYNNPVSGTDDDEWTSTDPISGKKIFVKAGSSSVNPYRQVQTTREYMAKVIASNNDAARGLDEHGWKNLISAAVIFSDDLKDGATDSIIVDTSLFNKWFYHGRVSETAEILRSIIPGKNGIETSEKAVRIIKDVFGLQEADLAKGVPVPKCGGCMI